MTIEVVYECPLGSKCERVSEGKIIRCRWYKEIMGHNPQTEEEIHEWDCAIAWLPLLTVEMAGTNRGQTAALESFRNEMVRQNQGTLQMIRTAAETEKALEDNS